MKCLRCDERELINLWPKYLVCPSQAVASVTYYVCKKHAYLDYHFNDIFNSNGSQKEIDHAAVEERSKND